MYYVYAHATLRLLLPFGHAAADARSTKELQLATCHNRVVQGAALT